MPPDRDERIRQRAYDIWEREGRPHGRDEEHWRMALDELVEEFSDARFTHAEPAAPAAGTAKPGGESSAEAQPSKPVSGGDRPRPMLQADPLGRAQPKSGVGPARRNPAKPRKPGSSAPGGPSRPH